MITNEEGHDNTFRLFGHDIVNLPPLIAIAWITTLILIAVDVTLIFTHPDLANVLIPLLISAVSLWTPSPASAVKTPIVQVPLTLTHHPSYEGTTRVNGVQPQ